MKREERVSEEELVKYVTERVKKRTRIELISMRCEKKKDRY